jgi:phage anti-repressor protein
MNTITTTHSHEYIGTLRAIRVGPTCYYSVSDISQITGREINQIRGCCFDSDLITEDGDLYLKESALDSVLNVNTEDELLLMMIDLIHGKNKITGPGNTIRAKLLHYLLGVSEDFEPWRQKVITRFNPFVRTVPDTRGGRDSGENYLVPLPKIYIAARHANTFGGIVLVQSMDENKFLHSPAKILEEALAEYRRLIPGDPNVVNARILHEFLIEVVPYDAWIQHLSFDFPDEIGWSSIGELRTHQLGNSPQLAENGSFYLSTRLAKLLTHEDSGYTGYCAREYCENDSPSWWNTELESANPLT